MISQYVENKFEFNGKRLNNMEFGDASGLDWYDYGMREYDPQISRFFRIDPLGEKYFSLTPYQYASDDPVANIDIDGLEGTGAAGNSPTKEEKHGNTPSTSVWKRIKNGWNDFNNGQGAVYRGLDWFNRNVNPLGLIAHGTSKLVAGKDLITGEKADRLEGAAEIGTGALSLFGARMFPSPGMAATEEISVWGFNRTQRGRIIERMLGGNLPKGFPVIDKLENGVATSIKSIDVTLDSYTKKRGLFNTLNKYINDLANFERGARSGVVVEEGEHFTEKILEVAIQTGKASLQQWAEIGEAMAAAKENNIRFILRLIK